MSQIKGKTFFTFFSKKVTFHVTFSTISRKSTYQLKCNYECRMSAPITIGMNVLVIWYIYSKFSIYLFIHN